MKKINKAPFVLIGLLLWTAVAIIASTTAFIALRGSHWSLWLSLFKPMLTYYLLWGAMAIVIFKVVGAFSQKVLDLIYAVPLHLLLFALATVGFNFIVHPHNWREWLYGELSAGYLTLSAMIYILITMGCFIIRYFQLIRRKERHLRRSRLRESLLHNQLQLAQMDVLKMQINPHFLFNALNSIAALIETDRKVEAYDTTEMLGGLLRESLAVSDKKMITLADELSILERYMAMESLRYKDRFTFTLRCEDALLACMVPSFIVQPLIENIFKHAVSQTPLCISIHMNIILEEGFLMVQVINDNVDKGSGCLIPSGSGLKNLDDRLQVFNGKGQWLSVMENCNDQFVIVIKIKQEKT